MMRCAKSGKMELTINNILLYARQSGLTGFWRRAWKGSGYGKHQELAGHKAFDASLHEEMSVWREATLDKLLLLFAIINAVVTTIQFWAISYTPPLWEILLVISFSIIMFVVAFLQSIPHLVKGIFLLFLAYVGITKQLWMHGLVSTAPISLAIIPLIAFLLINPLTGWISGIASTLLFFAFTIVHEFGGPSDLVTPHADPFDTSVWLEIGLSLIGMMGVLLVIVDQYYRLTLGSIRKEKAQAHKTAAAQIATTFAMAKLAEFRDTDTGGHLERVREYSRLLSETMQAETKYRHLIDAAFIENIYHASALHDIGKVAISDAILRKPGKLSEEEFTIMKSHATVGAEKLQIVYASYPDNNFLKMGIRIALAHHEWWNGEGYPHGLRGEAIPLEGRIMALADAYDALTTERPYKKPFSHAKSRDIIVAQRGKQFDPDVVDAFISCQDRFYAIRQNHSANGVQDSPQPVPKTET